MKQGRFAGTNLTPNLVEKAMYCLYSLYGYLLDEEAKSPKKHKRRGHVVRGNR